MDREKGLLTSDQVLSKKAGHAEIPWQLTQRQLCDLEMIINGGFSPLEGFMGEKEYNSVIEKMRLLDGSLWPIPITLDVNQKTALLLKSGRNLLLKNVEGRALASLEVEKIWKPDRVKEAELLFGTINQFHPGVHQLFHATNDWYVGGKITLIHKVIHQDYKELRKTPKEVRQEIKEMGWKRTVAFQTRNPMHRVHFEMTLRAIKELDAGLLIHPVVGATKPGDIEHYTRVSCYQALLPYYPKGKVLLSLLPIAMRMAGPKEALWHAMIRKNYGCTHLIVGRDHAGPGNDQNDEPFYPPYAAQELLKKYASEIALEMVPFKTLLYVKNRDLYLEKNDLKKEDKVANISGTELRKYLKKGEELPRWYTFPEIAKILQKRFPKPSKRGFTIFFTGLSASGKSTLAKALQVRLYEQERQSTLLDGDVVRTHLSSELGFSKEHRDLNIKRIGFVASEITKYGGIAICAPIAPYDSIRKEVRKMIEGAGGFFLIHVATPLEVCEKRDCKGLYAKAREGIIKNFTGINDPYEAPEDAEIIIDTTKEDSDTSVSRIIDNLKAQGWLTKT